MLPCGLPRRLNGRRGKLALHGNDRAFRGRDLLASPDLRGDLAAERLPDRAEKDALEAVHEAEPGKTAFSYNPARRIWERYSNGDPGGNIVDAARFGAALADGRSAGMGL